MTAPDKVSIEHIHEAISEIESYVKGINKEDFLRNSLIRSATVRQFEVIGEAVKALSEELKGQCQGVHWRLWADFRNILIHLRLRCPPFYPSRMKA
jgi:uncharacterized protein with HEPN domain